MAAHSEVVKLLIEHRSELFAFIFAALRDHHAAEEVMQNVAVVVCDKAKQFQKGSNFRAWAREIARRQVLQYIRESSRVPRAVAPAEIELLANAFQEAERDGLLEDRAEALQACLEGLSMRLSELIRLRYEGRLSLGQLAKRMGLQPESARKALYRARIALRKCIDSRLKTAS